MKTIKIFVLSSIAAIFLISVSLRAQEKPDTSGSNHKMMIHDHQKMYNMMHDSSNHHNMQGMNMSKDSSHQIMKNKDEKMMEKKSPLVREGVIDVNAIDKNKDGKVYEDMMVR
jgi:uncharacterized protein involved in copper resistance